MYSGARIIRIFLRENFVRIIHTSKSMAKHAVVRIRIVRIIWDARITEGQNFWAIL